MVKKNKSRNPDELAGEELQKAIEMYTLHHSPPYMKVNEIATKFKMHAVTVSRKITMVEKAMETQMARMGSVPQGAAMVAAAQPEADQGLMLIKPEDLPPDIIPDQNPFQFLATISQVAKPSIQAGIVPGAAILRIQAGFQDKTLPMNERATMIAQGCSSLGLMAFGLIETMEKLSKGSQPVQPAEFEVKK